MPEINEEWRDRIDTDVKNLSERIAGVETGIQSLSKSFDKFSHAFELSLERQTELQKTRWPVVFGVLSLALVVISGFMSGYLRDLNRIEHDVNKIQSKRWSENDPVQDARLKDLEKEVISIRASEHNILRDNAIFTEELKLNKKYRENIREHIEDGHPRRVEALLDTHAGRMLNIESNIEERMDTKLNYILQAMEGSLSRINRLEEAMLSK